MNSVQENIITRRSCRAYKADMVPMELIDQVIEAGLYAPSSLGEQSGIIICVSDKETRDNFHTLMPVLPKIPTATLFTVRQWSSSFFLKKNAQPKPATVPS